MPYEPDEPEHDLKAATLEEAEIELGADIPPPLTEDTIELPMGIQSGLTGQDETSVANRPIYEAAAQKYQELALLQRQNGIPQEDIELWADAHNPIRMAEFGPEHHERLENIRLTYDMPSPQAPPVAISDDEITSLPMGIREKLEPIRAGANHVNADLYTHAAGRFIHQKRIQERYGLTHEDTSLMAEAMNPLRLAKFTREQNMRLASIKTPVSELNWAR